jgi:hypothetical protein
VVDETKYRPASWDENAQGIWHPVVDGYIVPSTQGQYTKCRQPPVDYLPWQRLHFPAGNELTDVSYYRGGPSISNPLPINTEANPDTLDRDGGRIRVPYGFATDSWADVGNASVYRHDNGADTYEIFDFLITQQEVQHIFDAYRRHRNSFSVRSAAERILTRYNEKIRDGAKGLGLLANIYRDFADTNGWVFEGGYWAFIANLFYRESILASSMTFDHFVRTMARPEAGGHYRDKASVLRSEEDTYANNTIREVLIPNGATGYFGQIGVGGKLIENRLSENHGEYDRDYTINAGSYYDKVYAPYLMTESEDNFISDSRSDFVDGRYRAVSLADLFPDGFRRWMGNNLTGDDFLKGPRLAASATGKVLLDDQKYPSWPIGWVSWWTETPEVCFPATGTVLCSSFGGDNEVFDPRQPEGVAVLDPQVNWKQQKFLIAMTLLYLPSNQKEYWINQLRLWQLGPEADPGFQNRIEFHDPYGKVYVAKSFGTETQFGKVVQKGIAARVLEYANQLLAKGYETTPIDWDENGQIDWYEPVMNPETGTPNVKWDSSMMFIDPSTGQFVGSLPDCNKDDNSGCPCSANSACKLLGDYVSVPFYLWEAFYAYRLLEPDDMKGIYE